MPQESVTNVKNRRAFIRRGTRGKAKVACFKGSFDMGPNLAVSIANLSEAGINLLLKVELAKGQDVTLLVEGREHNRPLKVHGKVIWSVALEKDLFRVGVRLNSHLRYQEIIKIT
jgi:PilZ domain